MILHSKTSLVETIGNKQWMVENSEKIIAILPETWTHIQNLNGLRLGFQLKLIGVDWRSKQEFGACMVFFERIGLMKRDGLLVRRGRAFTSDQKLNLQP